MDFRRLGAGIIIGLLLDSSLISGISPAWGQDPNPKTEEPSEETLQNVVVLAGFDLEGPILRFDWGEKKPALAVVKGAVGQDKGQWWIVFDERANVSLPDLPERPIPGLVNIDIVPAKGGIVLQIIVDARLTPVIVQEGDKWEVLFKSQPLTIEQSAFIQLPQTKKEGLIVSLKALGKKVHFTDSHTGYAHVVFPTRQVGFGMAESQSFPEFQISAMAQGVGFQLLKNNMTIEATLDQATVMPPNPEGLAITLPREREQVRTRPIPQGVFADAKDIDRVGRQKRINNEELPDLPHDQHGPGEVELAWLLLSDGHAAEALGYLTHLAQMRPSIANLPLFQMLQGMGSLLLNQWRVAERLFQSVPEEPEVQIWVSLLKALQYPQYFIRGSVASGQLHSQFQMARSLLPSYPTPLRHQMVTLILMAGIATDDVETLTSVLDQETRSTNVREGNIYDLAKARVLMGQKKPDASFQLLGELMEKAVSSDVRDMARFYYVVDRLETKMMKEQDALPQLEHLRSQGRGGWLGRRVASYLAECKARKTKAQ